MVKKLLSVRGTVASIELGKIPGIYFCKILSNNRKYEITLELHEKLKIINEGDKVSFELFDGEPRKISESDFIGRGYLFKITKSDNKEKYVLSIGGLVVTIIAKEPIKNVSLDKDYYVKLHKL